MRCRLDPFTAAAKTIKNHLWGTLNAIILKVSYGPAEGINSWIKTSRCVVEAFEKCSGLPTPFTSTLETLIYTPKASKRVVTH